MAVLIILGIAILYITFSILVHAVRKVDKKHEQDWKDKYLD